MNLIVIKNCAMCFLFALNIEYDDGDGDVEGYDNSYGSSSYHQNSTPSKRRNGNDLSTDDPDDLGNGENDDAKDESSTSAEGAPKKKRRKEFLNLNATFMTGIQGVQLVTDQPRLGNLQDTIQKMCKFDGAGFPGSQPVSMDTKNIQLLGEKPYRVSWKADGTRYMMLILKEHEVYFFDRDNACFQVSGMRFPCHEDLRTHIYDTLIDGEMVIDKVNGLTIPRYLVYDIICYNGIDYMDFQFFSTSVCSRMKCIKEYIVGKRLKTSTLKIL